MGERLKPGIEHLLKLGEEANITKNRIHDIIDKTQSSLVKWLGLAQTYGVSINTVGQIKDRISRATGWLSTHHGL